MNGSMLSYTKLKVNLNKKINGQRDIRPSSKLAASIFSLYCVEALNAPKHHILTFEWLLQDICHPILRLWLQNIWFHPPYKLLKFCYLRLLRSHRARLTFSCQNLKIGWQMPRTTYLIIKIMHLGTFKASTQ